MAKTRGGKSFEAEGWALRKHGALEDLGLVSCLTGSEVSKA